MEWRVLLGWITVLTTVAAGYLALTALIIPFAAVALMAESVLGKAWHLHTAGGAYSSKIATYLVMGAMGWLGVAWFAYLAGGLLRGIV